MWPLVKYFLVFILLGIRLQARTGTGIERYTKEDLLSAQEPLLIFIYYEADSTHRKCMACEGYKKWLLNSNGVIGPFKVKSINFFSDPILALRFRAVNFPTFFVQYRKAFKNISDVNFFSLQIKYSKEKYKNDIDAIIKNPKAFERIKNIPSIKSPLSVFSLIYAHSMFIFLTLSHLLERIERYIPSWAGLSLVFSVLILFAIIRKIISKNVTEKINKEESLIHKKNK